ncbi:hypothetical protein ACFQI3_03040 [Hansschlegelia quercus]|uniref:hypothetical protein n=1 Tax=Hansschlegelia quercus TaxID=2528245 RepID=UPI0013EF051B|nr:hypothetical protein [Hansschlegelia quercus]
MATYSLHAAQEELDDLIDRSEKGETVGILRSSGRRVSLVALAAERARLADGPAE